MITTAVTRYSLDILRNEILEEEVQKIEKPKELTNLIKWETFWEQWKTYMGRLRGAAKCPLTYIFRNHEQVDPAMYNENYADHDSWLINTMILAGP